MIIIFSLRNKFNVYWYRSLLIKSWNQQQLPQHLQQQQQHLQLQQQQPHLGQHFPPLGITYSTRCKRYSEVMRSEDEFNEFEPRRWTANYIPIQIARRIKSRITGQILSWTNHDWPVSRRGSNSINPVTDFFINPNI